MHLIRRLTYNPSVARIVRALRLRRLARSVYYRLFMPRGARFTATSNGVQASYWVRDALEHRLVEASWLGEQGLIDELTRTLKPGDVFLDVGSNLGMFSMVAGVAVGPTGMVIAFEPEARAHARLRANIDLNSLSATVKAYDIALSDKRGKISFVIGGEADISQTSHLVDATSPTMSTITVDAWEGDAFLEAQGLRTPTTIKVDVEGHEFSVLHGLRRVLSNPICRLLLCELHPHILPQGTTVEDIVQLVRGYGFTSAEAEPRNEQLHLIATRAAAL